MDALALPEFPGEEDGGFVLQASALSELVAAGLMRGPEIEAKAPVATPL